MTLQEENEKLRRLLREAYEAGYIDGQNNPNGYGDKAERDKCVADLLSQPAAGSAVKEPTSAMIQAACAAFRMDVPPMLAMQSALRAALSQQTKPVRFCEDTALSLAERIFSSEVDEQLAEDVIRYARRLHDLYTVPQPAEQQPIRSDLARAAANHLTYWLELDWCECEGGHTCGYNEVKRTRDALLEAAEQQPTSCIGCEGVPAPENSPCAVCGQESMPDVGVLVEALEQIKAIEDEIEGGDWDEIEKARNIACEALTAYRKGGE